jgi:hypothetical protein
MGDTIEEALINNARSALKIGLRIRPWMNIRKHAPQPNC